MTRTIYLDPAYPDFYGGKLFTAADDHLNRDDQLQPFRRLKAQLEAAGHTIETADAVPPPGGTSGVVEYYSLGITANFRILAQRDDVRLRAFALYEPPVVVPSLYARLPELTRHFEAVYVHNTHGDGYSLEGVDRSKLRKLDWFQQFEDVLVDHWSRQDRLHKACVINANKKPASMDGELYGERVRAVAELAQAGAVDLYGRGWDRVVVGGGRFRRTVFAPVLRHHRTLRRVWKGAPPSKFEVLARYEFCLCLENMTMDGFMTEKLFDCLYAGTIPIYLGPNDVDEMVPPDVHIDAREFGSWTEAWEHAASLTDKERQAYREAGRDFIRGEASERFKRSLDRMLDA